MKNKMLERHLFTAVGMSNLLLKQAEDLMEKISRLKKIYSIEDLEKSSEKLLGVSKKICETKKILDRAVEKYGERQLDQAQEELAELIVAISKYKRAVDKDRNTDKAVIDVIEEIADVNIMIKQVMMLLDIEEFEVQNIEIAKLNRLEKGWIVNEQR